MNKKNKKTYETIMNMMESHNFNTVLNDTEKELFESAIYRTLIDIELNKRIMAAKNKWIVELLNEIEEQEKEIKKYKRYFKIAINDLKSEGQFLESSYKEIEEYYSRRNDEI